jgi:TonB family protein
LLALAPSPVSAEGLVLEPSSDWKLREYDDKCRARRTFGEGKQAVTLWLDQGGARQNFNVTLLGDHFAHPYGPAIRVKPGDEEELIRSYITAKSSKGRPVLRMYGLTLVQPELERDDDAKRPEASLSEGRMSAIETIAIRGAGLRPVLLRLGPMRDQFAFLQDCGRRLEFALSTTSRALEGEASPPEPIGHESWLQVSDWPAYLQRAEMEGEITVRLTVSKTGRPASCSVLGSNKPQLFDDAVCLALMKRARFKPARDGEGEPIASYFATGVTFRFK